METAPATAGTQRRARGFIAASIYLFEKLMPDPFTLAIGITVLVAVAAMLFAPKASLGLIVTAWHDGVFSILTFTFQTVLVLVSGHALAHAPPVQRGFRALAGAGTHAQPGGGADLPVGRRGLVLQLGGSGW